MEKVEKKRQKEQYVVEEMREQIRQVMRFSGPRMLLYHPVLAVWHLICSKKELKINKKVR